MGERMRAHNWSCSPIGVPETWPQALRTAVNIMLTSRQPMFIAWGPKLAFLYNDGYIPIFGGKHPHTLGLPFAEVWSEIWDDIRPLVDRALAGEATWSENLHLVMERNGYPEDTWYTFSYSPLRDEFSEVAGMFCACMETTAQVIAERRSTAERERLFELTRDLFGVATFDGYLKSINPAWSRILGRSEAALLAEPFTAIIHPEDLPATAAVLERLQSGSPEHQFQIRLLKADGGAVSFAWTAVPDATPGSNIFYAVGRDITDDLRREEQLRQSQKMEAVGLLTGGVAHDFNNLLQVVSGNLDLIRRNPADPARVVRLASNGLLATERGVKLTAQLLAFSRAQKPDIRTTPVSPLIAGMDEILRRSLGPTIQIEFEIGGDGLCVMADPTQLEMALLNLAINARDAMPGGGALHFSARDRIVSDDAELLPGRYVEIRVADTGTGMSADTAVRAFDPFFTTKGVGKGTGLGLSQVYAMAKQAGGVARIDRSERRGTVIALLLKAAELEDPSESPDDVVTSARLGRGRTVLVVDDDLDVLLFLRDALEALGCKVITAQDGMSGLDALGRADPDLLLLDFAMPGMNGAEVADRARVMRPELPIIFASGYAETAAIEAALGDGAVIMRKPFRVADLEAVLQTLY